MEVAGNLVSVTGGHGDADMLSSDQALPHQANFTHEDCIALAVSQFGVIRPSEIGGSWNASFR
jgi:Na+/glutamate symporter